MDIRTARGLRQGLKEVGFAEGENVRIVYRWAENQLDRLPEMAADLIREQPAVIFTTGGPASASSQLISPTLNLWDGISLPYF
jgi:ABC-type uncharacterized transport system substrate-binding protein